MSLSAAGIDGEDNLRRGVRSATFPLSVLRRSRGLAPRSPSGLPALLFLLLPCFSSPVSPLSSPAPGRDVGSAAPAQPSLVPLPRGTQAVSGISRGLGASAGVRDEGRVGLDPTQKARVCPCTWGAASSWMGMRSRGGSQTPPELVLAS